MRNRHDLYERARSYLVSMTALKHFKDKLTGVRYEDMLTVLDADINNYEKQYEKTMERYLYEPTT